jgi:Molybdopterin oxidoreductase Fe4S4 domain
MTVQCPFSRAKQTSRHKAATSANDPKQTLLMPRDRESRLAAVLAVLLDAPCFRMLGVVSFFAAEPLREATLGLGQVSRRFSVWLLHCVKLSERPAMDEQRKIKSFCALCVARCGAIATVERGRFVSLEPDPSHPTGQALCAKGRASPELVYSSDRLLHPLKRTRP